MSSPSPRVWFRRAKPCPTVQGGSSPVQPPGTKKQGWEVTASSRVRVLLNHQCSALCSVTPTTVLQASFLPLSRMADAPRIDRETSCNLLTAQSTFSPFSANMVKNLSLGKERKQQGERYSVLCAQQFSDPCHFFCSLLFTAARASQMHQAQLLLESFLQGTDF